LIVAAARADMESARPYAIVSISDDGRLSGDREHLFDLFSAGRPVGDWVSVFPSLADCHTAWMNVACRFVEARRGVHCPLAGIRCGRNDCLPVAMNRNIVNSFPRIPSDGNTAHVFNRPSDWHLLRTSFRWMAAAR
jgi:hypothetical protein